jgi:hypothetical protein
MIDPHRGHPENPQKPPIDPERNIEESISIA